MKKNYIKPVSKTVIAEMASSAMGVIASEKQIGNGGDDDGTHTPQAPEREEEEAFFAGQEKNTYSLW